MSMSLTRPMGWKRPLQKCCLFSTQSSSPHPVLWNRLKVQRTAPYEWSHSDLPFSIQLGQLAKAAAALLTSYGIYRSVEIVPAGTVGVKPDTQEIVPPGWYVVAPWTPRLQHYSTRHQSIRYQTRVLDSKNIKVFVNVLVEFQLKDPKGCIEQLQAEPKPSLYQDPQAFFQHYQDGPTRLKTLVTRQSKAVVQEQLLKENAIDVQFGVQGRSVLELGNTLTKKLQNDQRLSPHTLIHRVTVDQLEFPHWVVDHIDQHTKKSWTMEAFVTKRQQKRIDLQKQGQERLRQLVAAELEKDNEGEKD